MKLTYKRATIQDLDILTTTRIEVLRAANHLSADTDMSEVEKQSHEYYKKALPVSQAQAQGSRIGDSFRSREAAEKRRNSHRCGDSSFLKPDQ